MMKLKLSLVSMLAAGVCAAAPSLAQSSYTWNFATNSSNGELAVSQIFYANGNTSNPFITAYGYETSHGPSGTSIGDTWNPSDVNSVNLYAKYTGGNPTETGLGLNNDTTGNHEIEAKGNSGQKNYSFLQLNVSNLLSNNIKNFNIAIASVQNGEGFDLWGSNSLNTPGTLLSNGGSSTNGKFFNVPDFGTYKYYTISAYAGNVLLENGATSNIPNSPPPAPEASSVFGLAGMLGVGGLALRRRKTGRTAA